MNLFGLFMIDSFCSADTRYFLISNRLFLTYLKTLMTSKSLVRRSSPASYNLKSFHFFFLRRSITLTQHCLYQKSSNLLHQVIFTVFAPSVTTVAECSKLLLSYKFNLSDKLSFLSLSILSYSSSLWSKTLFLCPIRNMFSFVLAL